MIQNIFKTGRGAFGVNLHRGRGKLTHRLRGKLTQTRFGAQKMLQKLSFGYGDLLEHLEG